MGYNHSCSTKYLSQLANRTKTKKKVLESLICLLIYKHIKARGRNGKIMIIN